MAGPDGGCEDVRGPMPMEEVEHREKVLRDLQHSVGALWDPNKGWMLPFYTGDGVHDITYLPVEEWKRRRSEAALELSEFRKWAKKEDADPTDGLQGEGLVAEEERPYVDMPMDEKLDLIFKDMPEMKDNWKHRGARMKCCTCMWYVPKVESFPTTSPEIGRCRRHGPTADLGYPAVFPADWCGDHKVDQDKL